MAGDRGRERRFDRLKLNGLDEAGTEALVAYRLRLPVTPEFVRRLREQTDGNAFFIEETIRALSDSGVRGDVAVGEEALERLGVPEGIAEVIARRVRKLTPLAARLLTALTRVALLSQLCARLGDMARAGELDGLLEPHAARNVVVAYCSFWGPVDAYLALLAEARGDAALAARHLDSAIARARAAGAPLLAEDLARRARPADPLPAAPAAPRTRRRAAAAAGDARGPSRPPRPRTEDR